MTQTYFVTGALGCIGAWVVKTLVDRGDIPVVFDIGGDPRRIRDLLDDAAFERIRFVTGDIGDFAAVRAAIEHSGARKAIHLAGLQVPFCKADPAAGARVNVLGTVHVLEAARQLELERIVYASSAAVFGREDGDAPDETTTPHPTTHYGVYKRANEGNARVYWHDNGVESVGIRPLTVFGVGRDQGLTSGPTSAMKAAAIGRPYVIGFRGATDFNYVADTAQAFVACADRAPRGAHVFNLHGDSVRVERIVELIEAASGQRGLISFDGPELPVPPALDGHAIHAAIPDLEVTPLESAVTDTLARFRALAEADRLDTRDLDQ